MALKDTHVMDELKWRGFIEQMTDEEGLREILSTSQPVYIGFDPTADSLHIGSLIPMIALSHFQRCGHKAIGLVGGATGMIGDPSGKSEERNLQDLETISVNLEGIKKQIGILLDFDGEKMQPPAKLVNNADWTKDITMLEWMRDIGKLFTINYMVAKESVRRRFEDRDQGISFTELSYMLLQAHDFYQLYKQEGCRVQAGGSDQWGNITAGIELIRRKGGPQAYGVTFPLLTTASGQKFGKSEGNAIYLDAKRTSIWDFYQYWVRTEDADVIRFLKLFTYVEQEDIENLAVLVEREPEKREAQKRLAYEVTTLIHGEDQAKRMVRGAEALYAGRLEDLDRELIQNVFADGPSINIDQNRIQSGGPIADLFAESGLLKSKGEARRMLQQGALYINNKRVTEEDEVTSELVLPSGMIVLRKGKKNYMLISVNS